MKTEKNENNDSEEIENNDSEESETHTIHEKPSHPIINFLKNKKKYIVGILAAALLAYIFLSPDQEIRFYTEQAVISDVNQIVYVTGTVESDKVVDLRFQQSGKIEKLIITEGQKVEKDDTIATLENETLEISTQRALAALNMAKADLNLEYAGPTDPEIEISKIKITETEINLENSKKKLKNTKLSNQEKIKKAELEIDNVQIALANAETSYKNTITTGGITEDLASQELEDAYEDAKAEVIEANDLVRETLYLADDFLGIDDAAEEADYQNLLQKAPLEDEINSNNSYKYAWDKLEETETAFNEIKNTWEEQDTKIEEVLIKAEDAVIEIKDLMDTLYRILEEADQYGTVTQSDINSLASSFNSQKSSLTTILDSIQGTQQKIRSEKLELTSTGISTETDSDTALATLEDTENELEIVQSSLGQLIIQNQIEENELAMTIDVNEIKVDKAFAEHDKLIAGPRNVDIAALQAKVSREQADYNQALKELNDTTLTAPASGIITKINFEVGENITTQDDAVTMMADKLQITTNISETDITKVEIQDKVDITFDAFPADKIFEGEIVSIDPAETVVQGVIYYEAKIIFDPQGLDVKSGMTANLDILTESKQDVLTIPPQAINYEDNKIFVFIIQDNEKVRREIKTGLEGENQVEVLEGILEGDKVLIYENSQ
jgi:multidrug efflux pump subunit AcrA (membrane-fusion protein)